MFDSQLSGRFQPKPNPKKTQFNWFCLLLKLKIKIESALSTKKKLHIYWYKCTKKNPWSIDIVNQLITHWNELNSDKVSSLKHFFVVYLLSSVYLFRFILFNETPKSETDYSTIYCVSQSNFCSPLNNNLTLDAKHSFSFYRKFQNAIAHSLYDTQNIKVNYDENYRKEQVSAT